MLNRMCDASTLTLCTSS